MSGFSLYVVDTETTSILTTGDIIEISFYRVATGEQKTWYLKAVHEDAIQADALRINKHKLEDITWKTKEGIEKYRLPEEVLPEIENWIADDGIMAMDRVLVGHNVSFDEKHMRVLWERCNAADTFPFGTNSIDTKAVALFFDWAQDEKRDRYALSSLIKSLGLSKRAAHRAEEDVLMCVDLLNHYKQYVNCR